MIRFAFSRSITRCPSGVIPLFPGAIDPSPAWLAGL